MAVAQDTPKADLFFGYSGYRANAARDFPSFLNHGGLGTLGLNFNPYVAFESEIGGYHNGNINNLNIDSTSMTYLFGPRVSFRRSRRVVPYIHSLFGGVHATSSVPVIIVPAPFSTAPETVTRLKNSQDAFAMAVGGGLDIKLSHHVMFRPFQFDYLLTRLQDLGQTGPSQNRNQHNVRYAGGLIFTFGGEKPTQPTVALPPPEPPKMKTCPGGATVGINEDCPRQDIALGSRAVAPQLCQGGTITIEPNTTLPADAVVVWSVNGQEVSRATKLEFGTSGRDPGVYNVHMRVTAPGFNDATQDRDITVLGYKPPTGTLTAAPGEIFQGDKSGLIADFKPGQCGGALSACWRYSASEGSIVGDRFDSTGVQFAPPTNSEQRKSVTITAQVRDERGTAMAQANVVVKQPGLTSPRQLADVLFAQGSDRVNNCGKRVLLEELRNVASTDPSGRVVFVGHVAEGERTKDLDLKRALNAAAVISAGADICTAFPASQILLNAAGSTDNGIRYNPNFCSGSTAVQERPGQSVDASDDSAKYRRVEVWFVPSAASMPSSSAGAKDAATLGVASLGCPR